MKMISLFLTFVFAVSANAASKNTFEISLDEYENGAPILVPPGNRNNAAKDFDQGSFNNILNLITKPDNICVVKKASELYQVTPVSIMGSIIGEHTYNVDAWDIAGENYLYMVKRWISRFESNGLDLLDMLSESKYAQCDADTHSNYDMWNCYNNVWKKDSRNYDGKDIKWRFFNPTGAGYTYGFGQFGPERALMVTDIVEVISGFPAVSLTYPEGIYDAILNPQTSIHYVAATNRIAIDIYMSGANFDISQNPGIIATLYNLGKEAKKAGELRQKTLASIEKNGKASYPEVNYYGWFINSQQETIQKAYDNAIKKVGCP